MDVLIWACWGCNRRHPRCGHRLGRRIVRLPCECVRSRACPRPRAHSRPICLTLVELPLRRSDAALQSYLSNWEHYVEKHGNLSALEAAGKTFDASEKNAGCHLRNCEKSPIKLPASPYSCRAHTPSSPTVALIALLKHRGCFSVWNEAWANIFPTAVTAGAATVRFRVHVHVQRLCSSFMRARTRTNAHTGTGSLGRACRWLVELTGSGPRT